MTTTKFIKSVAAFCVAGAVYAAAHEALTHWDGYDTLMTHLDDWYAYVSHWPHHESYISLSNRWARENEDYYKTIMTHHDGDRYTIRKDRGDSFNIDYLYDAHTGKVYFTDKHAGWMTEVDPKSHGPTYPIKYYLIPDISKMRDWTSTGDPQEISDQMAMERAHWIREHDARNR
jgi:hypothetical protein